MIKEEIISTLPETPGVYIFKDKNNAPIYIGKAKNLKSRVSSYFGTQLTTKTEQMMKESQNFSFIRVGSEFEALLLEAKMVRLKMPKYNIELKDDKSPLYIGITKETYPRVITLRKPELSKYPKLGSIYGPFTQGSAAKRVLRIIRRIFPYADHKLGKRPCIYHQIGLCNPCPSSIDHLKNEDQKKELTKKYQSNINKINKILSGNLPKVVNDLSREMRKLSDQEKYEEASIIHDKLKTIEYITTPQASPELYMKDPNFLYDIREKELEKLREIIKKYFPIGKIERIECFDIAHLAGTHPTASMVTFIMGEPDKTLYRHFKIKSQQKADDIASMTEVLTRRKKKFDPPPYGWGKPDLIIVDGGKTQLNAALKVIGGIVPIVGLAKRYETIVLKYGEKYIEVRLPNGPVRNLVQRIRNEAHRFARRLHHRLIEKSILPK